MFLNQLLVVYVFLMLRFGMDLMNLTLMMNTEVLFEDGMMDKLKWIEMELEMMMKLVSITMNKMMRMKNPSLHVHFSMDYL